MVSSSAVVRFPVSSVVALAVMAYVFQFLYATVMQPQMLTATMIKPIEFRPLITEQPAKIKRNEVTPPPKRMSPPSIPSIGGRLPGEVIGPNVIPLPEVGPPQPSAQGGVSGIPQPLVRIDPEYPTRAQQSGIEGWVQLRFTVTAAGTIADVTVIDSNPKGVFDAAASRAVQRWKYAPKVDDGRAVEMRGMQVILRFDLKNAR